MPTGYTADVGAGKLTTFADFALNCSRAFGAMILLRDNEQSLSATRSYIEEKAYLGASSYYEDEIEKARTRLAELEAMTDAEATLAAMQAADETRARNAEIEAERREKQERYEAMLAKVEAWEPPTEDHVKFKEFMVDQLRRSIEFDCTPFAMTPPAVEGWREREIEAARNRIERSEREIEEERSRNESREQWVTALLDSLEAVPA